LRNEHSSVKSNIVAAQVNLLDMGEVLAFEQVVHTSVTKIVPRELQVLNVGQEIGSCQVV
jgi:hypothetical protein